VQMPEHTRGRDEAHVEATTTGFVSPAIPEGRLMTSERARTHNVSEDAHKVGSASDRRVAALQSIAASRF